MLVHLHVKNLALIEEAEVDFEEGLNILTGETGAGKSILMGAVNLALGQKMSREIIREGASYALVELVFQVSPDTEEKLRELEVFPEDGQVIITRRITESRSMIKVNGETCTAAAIKKAASLLLDVHGQHEHQSLLYPDKQMEILDEYSEAESGEKKEAVKMLYGAYRQIRKEAGKLRKIWEAYISSPDMRGRAAAPRPGGLFKNCHRFRILMKVWKTYTALWKILTACSMTLTGKCLPIFRNSGFLRKNSRKRKTVWMVSII